MTYRVITIPAAKQRIRDQAAYIATEQDDPVRAARWLQSVFDKIDSLAQMPRKYQTAAETEWRDYEIRRMRLGQFLFFYTIVEETKAVWVIHAKHTRQLTRLEDLPAELEDLDDGQA